METTKHKFKWYWLDRRTGEKHRRNSIQSVAGFGWDAECSCGWKTRTGGGVHSYVKTLVDEHKWDAQYGFLDSQGNPTYK